MARRARIEAGPARGPEAASLPYASVPGGLRLSVRLTPRAGRDAVDGVTAGADGRPALAVRVAAQPVEGQANAALTRFLAGALGLRKADVTILSGATGRLKILHLSGDGPALAARVLALLSGSGRA